jgi:hypothetical protein
MRWARASLPTSLRSRRGSEGDGCYASPIHIYCKEDFANSIQFNDPWPWDEAWDKRAYNGNMLADPRSRPRDFRRRCLVKAAALIVAEIERLARKEPVQP